MKVIAGAFRIQSQLYQPAERFGSNHLAFLGPRINGADEPEFLRSTRARDKRLSFRANPMA